MENLKEKEINLAYNLWRMTYEYQKADEYLRGFRSAEKVAAGCLRQSRMALMLSSNEMAKRLRITLSAYSRFERLEIEGRITLKALMEIAETMNCEVVYCIRPKSGKLFSETVWQSLYPKANKHSWVKTRPSRAKFQALAAVASWTMRDAEFRKSQGWTVRLK